MTFQDNTWVAYGYDDNRNLSSVTYSSGEKYAYANNSNGLVSQYTDADGNVTAFSYDSHNNLVRAASGYGTSQYVYDDNNQLISETDIKGNTTQYSYNSQGQLASVIDAASQKVVLSYGANGYLSSVSMEGVTLASYQYDDAGRVTKVTDRYGQVQRYHYDNINQVTEVASPGGRKTTIQAGSCPYMPSSKTLPGNRTYQYEYDANKRLKAVIDPMQGQTRLIRNKDGAVTGLIDANQNRTEFTYDVAGKPTSKTYADGNGLNYSYTSKGQLAKVTNARGISKTYQYDSSNKLTSIAYSDGTAGVSYQYDAKGRISTISDGSGTTTFAYAPTGELVSVDGPLDSDTIGFSYDNLYRLSAISVDGQTNSQYSYDAFGRITDITALGEVFSYTYQDTQSTPGATMTYPNGVSQVVSTNADGDLAGMEYLQNGATLASFGYEFNVAGKLSGLDTTEPFNAEPTPFKATYNEVNQIRTYNGQANVFDYDKDGNLIAGLLYDGTPFEAEYDAENRLTSILFTRDNVITEERFTYNFQHLMTSYERLENGVVAASKQFVRLGLLEMQERDGNGTVTAENAWRPGAPGGIGGLLVRKASDQKYTYMTNHLGHVYGVFDKTGNRVESHSYSAYGYASGDDFSLQPFGISTKRSDFASGLVYFDYRFYVPHLGRWLNRDPLQDQGGINLYAYVQGDPLGYVDPDGRFALVLGGVVGGIVGGPPGAVVGAALGAGFGVAICVNTNLCQFNESSGDHDENESCPSNDPENWERIRGSKPPAYRPKGDKEPIFQGDKAGGSHGGSRWKKFDKFRDWEKNRRSGTYNEDGRRLRDSI